MFEIKLLTPPEAAYRDSTFSRMCKRDLRKTYRKAAKGILRSICGRMKNGMDDYCPKSNEWSHNLMVRSLVNIELKLYGWKTVWDGIESDRSQSRISWRKDDDA